MYANTNTMRLSEGRKDRLVKLMCSEYGEQRLSSCSCYDISSSRNSSCTADVGSVGRMSFLIDNEKYERPQQTNSKPKKEDIVDNKAVDHEVILLRGSTSSCVEVKRYKGFWKIKKLFSKKKEKGCEKDGGLDDKSDVWVSDFMGVSKSRSLYSFRGGGFNDTGEGSDYRSHGRKTILNVLALYDCYRVPAYEEEFICLHIQDDTTWEYALPTWILKIPITFVEAAIWTILAYYPIGFDADIQRFFRYYFLLVCINQMASGLFLFMVALGRNVI